MYDAPNWAEALVQGPKIWLYWSQQMFKMDFLAMDLILQLPP